MKSTGSGGPGGWLDRVRHDRATLSIGDSGYRKCERCGSEDQLEVFLPHDLWARISGHDDGSGVLCLWCIDELAHEKNIRYGALLAFTSPWGSALSDDPEILRELKRLIVENSRLRAKLQVEVE